MVMNHYTWNAKDVLTEGERYYQGVGWYRAGFAIPRDGHGSRTFIRFEGVSLVADVFLNGAYVGKHRGGYSAFCFEITPYIVYGEENTLSVKVDNTMQPDVAPVLTCIRCSVALPARDCVSYQRLVRVAYDYASSGVTCDLCGIEGRSRNRGQIC
jgi:hypothetical protein